MKIWTTRLSAADKAAAAKIASRLGIKLQPAIRHAIDEMEKRFAAKGAKAFSAEAAEDGSKVQFTMRVSDKQKEALRKMSSGLGDCGMSAALRSCLHTVASEERKRK